MFDKEKNNDLKEEFLKAHPEMADAGKMEKAVGMAQFLMKKFNIKVGD